MEGFDTASVFNDDFAYFYAERVGAARTTADLEFLETITALRPGERVLDLCCGEGRIANHLATTGAGVIGLDSSLDYLRRAGGATPESQPTGTGEWRVPPGAGTTRTPPRPPPPPARYVAADARHLPFVATLDLIICWYTSFGYFDDETNREVLSELRRALRPGGGLVLDLDAKEHLLRSRLPTQVRERGDDVMVEQFRWEETTSRVRAMRTVVRDGEVRRTSYFVRVFAPEELECWLADAGLVAIEILGEDGAPFRSGDRRMVARARRA